MNTKINSKNRQFSFIESTSREFEDPFQEEHFEDVMSDIAALEHWMKTNNIKNGWTLSEKLAFLRNVESSIRTGAAVRRTQLNWFAFAIGTVGVLLGLIIGMNT